MDVPTYHKVLIVTDAAINIAPTLEDKVDICQNAIDLARSFGVERPKVAILAAVETVNSKMPATLDAAALCKMAERGQIKGGLLDGPLAFDNAISRDAAKIKGITSEVAGDPDILLAPDLEAGNMVAKQLSFLANADSAGLVLGARVPVILTSRADSLRSRIASCAVGGARGARPAQAAVHDDLNGARARPMDDYALVLNAGSSSLKFCVYRRPGRGGVAARGAGPDRRHRHRAEARRRRTRPAPSLADEQLDASVRDGRAALDVLADWLRGTLRRGARARRRPPGRPRRRAVCRARASSRRRCSRSCARSMPLAPLHQPYNLGAIEAVAERLPGVPQVACFDTSFHRGQPAVAELVPLPKEIRDGGRAALRLPRALLRVHRLGPARGGARRSPRAA